VSRHGSIFDPLQLLKFDPDPAFDFDAYPNLDFLSDPDPDTASQIMRIRMAPDPQHWLQAASTRNSLLCELA
jgi:hypothetical protein